MAKDKTKVVVYSDWQDSFEYLTDEEAGKLIKHFFKYINDESPKLEDRLLVASWIPIEKTLKRDLNKWNEKSGDRSEKARIAGLASAEARRVKKELEATKSNSVVEIELKPTKSTDSVSDSVSDINKETDFKMPIKDIFMIYVRDKMSEKGELDKYKRSGRSYMMSTYDAWKLNDWKDGNDKKIKNWKTKAIMQLRYIK